MTKAVDLPILYSCHSFVPGIHKLNKLAGRIRKEICILLPHGISIVDSISVPELFWKI